MAPCSRGGRPHRAHWLRPRGTGPRQCHARHRMRRLYRALDSSRSALVHAGFIVLMQAILEPGTHARSDPRAAVFRPLLARSTARISGAVEDQCLVAIAARCLSVKTKCSVAVRPWMVATGVTPFFDV